MQAPDENFDTPIGGIPAMDEHETRLAKIVSAFNGKILYKFIVNLDVQQLHDDMSWLNNSQIPINECLYDVLTIVTMFHDKNQPHFTADELKDIEQYGIKNYLLSLNQSECLSRLDALTAYLQHLRKSLALQKKNNEVLTRESILKYLQELMRLYNACVPFHQAYLHYTTIPRSAFKICAKIMVTLLEQWPSENKWPLNSNSSAVRLDIVAMKQIAARMRNDVTPADQCDVDLLECNIAICASCDEIDRTMAHAGNPVLTQMLETQLQELFKGAIDYLIQLSSRRDREEKFNALYFRRLILNNVIKYATPQYTPDATPLTVCLYKGLDDLFHAFFEHSTITLSNFKEYLSLARVCKDSGVFRRGVIELGGVHINGEYELVRCFQAYLRAWLEFIRDRQDKFKESANSRSYGVLQTVSHKELQEHRSIILEFRKALQDLPHNHTRFGIILYPHFDQLMRHLTVDLDNRNAFLALIKDAFDIKHPYAIAMLRYYYESYTENLVARSFGRSHNAEGRIIGVKREELHNWTDLLKRVNMHWHDGLTGYGLFVPDDHFSEPVQQGFDFNLCYMVIIYRYFSHTHITAYNVEFAFELLNELKSLKSPETNKILVYFYADFIAFTHHAKQIDFAILIKMLQRLTVENELLIHEKQSLFCSYLKKLFSEVIIPEMVKEPKPSGVLSMVDNSLSANDIMPMMERAGYNLIIWLDICNLIIRHNKKLIGRDPQYVIQLREIVTLLTPHVSAEPHAIALPKKMVNDEDETPKSFDIKALPASEQVDDANMVVVDLRAQATSSSSTVKDISKQTANPGKPAEKSDAQQSVKQPTSDKKDHAKDSQPSAEIDGSQPAPGISVAPNRHGFLWRNEKKLTSPYLQASSNPSIGNLQAIAQETQAELPALTERKLDSLQLRSKQSAIISADSPVIAKSSKPAKAPANPVNNAAVIEAPQSTDSLDKNKQSSQRTRQYA